MDEYLFIVVAKLNADRLKLEREARAAVGWRRESADDYRDFHDASRVGVRGLFADHRRVQS